MFAPRDNKFILIGKKLLNQLLRVKNFIPIFRTFLNFSLFYFLNFSLRTIDFFSRPMSSEYFVLLIIETAKMKEQPPIAQSASWISHESELLT